MHLPSHMYKSDISESVLDRNVRGKLPSTGFWALRLPKLSFAKSSGCDMALAVSQRGLASQWGSVALGTGSCSMWVMNPCWPPSPGSHPRSSHDVSVTCTPKDLEQVFPTTAVAGTGSSMGTEGAMVCLHTVPAASPPAAGGAGNPNHPLLQLRGHWATGGLVERRGHCDTEPTVCCDSMGPRRLL